MKRFIVYILHCADGSYYCGHTDDLEPRLRQHDDGDGSYTQTRRPVQLIWQGEFETRADALAFELQVKGWSRAKKEALIRGDWAGIQHLARSKKNVSTALDSSNLPPVRPEQVNQVEGGAPPRLRQAQPERVGEVPERVEEVPERVGEVPERSVELTERGVEVTERSGGVATLPPVRPEPGEGPVHREPFERTEPVPHPVRPEPVEGLTNHHQVDRFAQAVLSRSPATQRRGIAKAITLLESTRPDQREQADELLTELMPHCGQSFRLGISGVPGVGKSTFIEVLGLHLIAQGHRVAVLTVDPSSSISGGSILGDKTRMERLSVHPQAYIRPSPSSGNLGGVAEKTREAMLVFEAAGYDIVIVETVGVGQSELSVASMTDMFVLMQLPNAGDDLQAIKKGVMELADLVVINKADIDTDAATRAQAQISGALHLLGSHPRAHAAAQSPSVWQPQVIQVSALQGQGIEDFWAWVTQFRSQQSKAGLHTRRRQQQALAWMWERIDNGLKQAFREHPQVQSLLPKLTADVTEGRVPASTASRWLLAALKNY